MGLAGQGRLELTQEGDRGSKKWLCQSWGDILTDRLAKHRTQLAGAGGWGGGVCCPMALSGCQPYLPGQVPCPVLWGGPRGGGEGSTTQYRQECGAERVGVKASIGQPATPTAPQPRLPCTATGWVQRFPRSGALPPSFLGSALCPSTHPLLWQQTPALNPMPCLRPVVAVPSPVSQPVGHSAATSCPARCGPGCRHACLHVFSRSWQAPSRSAAG